MMLQPDPHETWSNVGASVPGALAGWCIPCREYHDTTKPLCKSAYQYSSAEDFDHALEVEALGQRMQAQAHANQRPPPVETLTQQQMAQDAARWRYVDAQAGSFVYTDPAGQHWMARAVPWHGGQTWADAVDAAMIAGKGGQEARLTADMGRPEDRRSFEETTERLEEFQQMSRKGGSA